MIVLGFATVEADHLLNLSEPTDGLAGRLNYYPAQAQVQFNCIKTFVRQNADWEAGYLFSRGETGRASYIGAEYAALYVSWAPPLGRGQFEVLRCNRAQALRQKGGYDVSWVFDRLHFLAEVTPAIVYVYFADVRGMPHHGRTSRLPLGPTGRTEILCVVGNQSARSELLVGETIVHELVIHAWREAAGASSSPEHRNWLHSGRPFSSHSAADIEADVLSYVARGRPPRFLDVSAIEQARHDARVREFVGTTLRVSGHGTLGTPPAERIPGPHLSNETSDFFRQFFSRRL